ncbi:Putative transposon-encoded protein [Syntrophus gentianae]|uniref:Putative transposon-encoded protein n=1 Tax=Syntrophus gentianae TaxID=43775 RepID=A0A1H7VRL3_9BACT|nr:DUF2080 family transposase-associated protein [Syntrophus gentianae]SEM11800.1 Putative transposon-encoded protein [Syntrophus gentianae]
MGTKESEKKSSLLKPPLSKKLSEKSEEKIMEPSSTKIEDQPVESTADRPSDSNIFQKVKFEVYGEEMISKEVKQSGNSGRVYLPPDWIGKHLKIIRID